MKRAFVTAALMLLLLAPPLASGRGFLPGPNPEKGALRALIGGDFKTFVSLLLLMVSPAPAAQGPYSITWDFESGNLQGWTKTGTAFDSQPTYGNNVAARRAGLAINHRGNYWIGTYENRPNPNIAEGTTQGDGPTGTLTSIPFTITGPLMTFLIGGGNDIARLRVELLVMLGRYEQPSGVLGLGAPVSLPDGTYTIEIFATGRNDEVMRRERFDLSRYLNKVARIRILDGSDRPWGHINVDDFQLQSRLCDDCDGDGHRSIAAGGDDCDDNDPIRYPGRSEVCDASGHDEDCDPETYGRRDLDRDGFSDRACFNQRPDGSTSRGEDCNDANRSVHPLATEVCDGIDNNCNGQVDEGVSLQLYGDSDGDGFGSATTLSITACHPRPITDGGRTYFLVFTNTDCDDKNPLIHPGQYEIRDGLDNNCNGSVDEEPVVPKNPGGGAAAIRNWPGPPTKANTARSQLTLQRAAALAMKRL